MKRITAFAYDAKLKALMLMRERRTEESDNFEILQLRLKNAFDSEANHRPHLIDVDISECAQVVKTFEVFTTPISVFSKEEALYGAACYV